MEYDDRMTYNNLCTLSVYSLQIPGECVLAYSSHKKYYPAQIIDYIEVINFISAC
jgi:hypothetical protein